MVTLGKIDESLAAVDVARRNFPNLKIVVRARNRRHAYLLMDRGITALVRETFHSSLKLSEQVLRGVGIEAGDAARTVSVFGDYDEQRLVDTHAFYTDERQLIQSSRQTADELADLLADDRRRQLAPPDEQARSRQEEDATEQA